PGRQLRWEKQGISGRTYQSDGNPSLYKKKAMVARSRASNHPRVLSAIDEDWWPYLKTQWIILNQTQVLPQAEYISLFSSIFLALIPMAARGEAEEAAAQDWGSDTSGLPSALARLGMPLEVFRKALTGLADKWTETVRTRDYVIFLEILRTRV
ncbi:unnamed protein product, partial [Discosporangium mesarthrocarpum]